MIWVDDEAAAASDDVARIIRAEYADHAYRKLADRALDIFRTQNPYSIYFHEPGWFLLQKSQDTLDRSIPAGAEIVPVETFLRQFPGVNVSDSLIITKTTGVGWVEANHLHRALKDGHNTYRRKVISLICSDTSCFGVKLGEEEIRGNMVILATGWRINGLLRSQNLPPMPYDIVGVAVLGVRLDEE